MKRSFEFAIHGSLCLYKQDPGNISCCKLKGIQVANWQEMITFVEILTHDPTRPKYIPSVNGYCDDLGTLFALVG